MQPHAKTMREPRWGKKQCLWQPEPLLCLPRLSPGDSLTDKPAKCPGAASTDQDKEGDADGSSDSCGDAEQQRVLKQLAFPEVEKSSFSADLCNKIGKCIQKRLSKIGETQKKLAAVQNKSSAVKGTGS